MPREEHDREDLLAEATALVERASFRIPGDAAEIVVGFRRDGCPSFYFGPQRVYHFTSAGSLRRAFVDDLLYKTERGRLVSLRRHRTEDTTELASHELDAGATKTFLDEMHLHLAALRRALAESRFTLIGQISPSSDVPARVLAWLEALPAQIAIARSPRDR
jgi:hypothetical protein